MKNYALILIVALLISSCSSFSFDRDAKSKTIEGTTEVPMNKVGTDFSPSIRIPSSFYTGTASAVIEKVEGGVTTVRFKATMPTSNPILSSISSKYLDSEGNLNCEGKFKITDEGILDYNNIDKEPFVLVKFDAKVGDKYVMEKSDGTVMTREVVRKSTDDDFLWDGLMIKTIDVEQEIAAPGVKKLVYFTNHKFGIVAVRAVMEDGTNAQVDFDPSAYLK